MCETHDVIKQPNPRSVGASWKANCMKLGAKESGFLQMVRVP